MWHKQNAHKKKEERKMQKYIAAREIRHAKRRAMVELHDVGGKCLLCQHVRVFIRARGCAKTRDERRDAEKLSGRK